MNASDSKELPWYEKEMLPEVCLRLRMACNGAADPWLDEKVEAVLAYLQKRLDNWHPSVSKREEILDGTVRLMVLATLVEVEQLRKR